ncbi:MAG: metal ABC transporter permease [Planctomycetota bacterium]|nr:MAG: metal ABC transporter permease [Planctomycetota bacterium]
MEIFKQEFMLIAMAAGGLAAIACCYLGVYVLLRRVVFVGVSIAQVSSGGVALGILIGLSPVLCSTVLTTIVVLLVAFCLAGRRIPREAVLGVIYVAGAAGAFLFLAGSAQAEAQTMNILFGDILTIEKGHLWLALGVFIPALLIQLLFYKEFLLVSFDPETAAAMGYNSRLWDSLFFVSLGAVISTAIMLVGVLVVFAFLVVPATAALLLANRLKTVLVVSVVLGLLATLFGFYFSYRGNLPPGPTISAATCVLLLLALVKPLIARFVRPGKV